MIFVLFHPNALSMKYDAFGFQPQALFEAILAG
jgi:hypothetical protein